MILKNVFLCLGILLAVTGFVSASSVNVNLFYDPVVGDSLVIDNGEGFAVIVSADALYESSMDIVVDLMEDGQFVDNMFSSTDTSDDSVFRYFQFDSEIYNNNVGVYSVRAVVTGASGSTSEDFLFLTVVMPDDDDDGYDNTVDCDDSSSSVWQNLTGYVDADGDGFGAGASVDVCSGASLPSGYAAVDGDCDEGNVSVWQNLTGYVDADGDGFGSGAPVDICSGASLPSGYAGIDGDCDNSSVGVNPGVLEICGDLVDNNCDGLVDDVSCSSAFVAVVSSSSLSGVFPLDVSFNCQGVGGNGSSSYFWDFGDGLSSVVQNPSHVYLDAGSFNASCRVSDADGAEVFGYVEIVVGEDSGDDESGDDDDDRCSPNWECSLWNSCVGGVEDRTCVDARDCGSARNMPVEVRSCSVSSLSDVSSNVINLGELRSLNEEDKVSLWWVVSGSLFFLIILVSLSLFFLKRNGIILA